MKKINAPRSHREFDAIPKIDHKELLDSAIIEAHLNINVTEDNLPNVIHNSQGLYSDFHHKQYLKAQVYFHDLQKIADSSEAESNLM